MIKKKNKTNYWNSYICRTEYNITTKKSKLFSARVYFYCSFCNTTAKKYLFRIHLIFPFNLCSSRNIFLRIICKTNCQTSKDSHKSGETYLAIDFFKARDVTYERMPKSIRSTQHVRF